MPYFANSDKFLAAGRDPEYFIRVPFAFSEFPFEIGQSPSRWVERTGNLEWYSKATEGGYFAALEVPEIFAEHLRNAFSAGGKLKTFNLNGGIKKDGLVIRGGIWDLERRREVQWKL